ncbi:MAG: AAA family ATPase [Deltaproteobacteria bacterium]
MTSAPTEGARVSYEAAQGLPAAGSKVCLSGFSRSEFEEASEILALRGLQATAFMKGADAILVPGRASAEVVAEAKRSGRRVILLDELREGTSVSQRRSAVEVTEDWVRVLDVTLPRRAVGERLVPSANRFRHLCLDSGFLRTARAVAVAARDGLPCALEGETATAKSTSITWLAWLCRQGLVRLNLHGQSDAGELVGRYVPASEWGDWDLAELQREEGLLEEQSRRIVRRAVSEKRPLNWVEQATVASNEGFPTRAWRFWEGYVPQAMRHGWWVILDEVNLAEPQVLERLNPVLESPPSLVLTEHDGLVFGDGGDVAVHPSFRMFATMNPAEYAGRTVLSPAFRDRFGIWNFVEQPGESELKAMLRCLVRGEQPEFPWAQCLWRAPDVEPFYPGLGAVADIDTMLVATASFHVAMASATGGTGGGAEVGRTRRERYTFTRRTLLSAMKLFAGAVDRGVAGPAALREALELAYVERVQSGGDRQAVRSALRAVGLAL